MLTMTEEDEENIAMVMSDFHARTESPALPVRDVIRMALQFHADQIRRRSGDRQSGQVMKRSNSTHRRGCPAITNDPTRPVQWAACICPPRVRDRPFTVAKS